MKYLAGKIGWWGQGWPSFGPGEHFRPRIYRLATRLWDYSERQW